MVEDGKIKYHLDKSILVKKIDLDQFGRHSANIQNAEINKKNFVEFNI